MMLGNPLLVLAFVTALFSLFLFLLGAKDKGKYQESGKKMYYLFFFFTFLACIDLLYLFLTHHFQVEYVYSYSSSDLPFFYLVSSFWAGQEGTFLLWLFFGALLGIFLMKRSGPYRGYVMTFYLLAQIFLLVLLLKKSPFSLLPDVPIEGRGLNPLLQDFWMVIHPPIVFVGYAALTVPFCYALAALVKNKYEDWIRFAFPWAAFSCLSLGAGIFIGGYWAYKVLGWGGYWGWDPVENASLVPWLLSVALVHGMLLEKIKGTMRKTNLLLAILSFLLILYATFLTRSGILGEFSVHSFSDLGINAYLMLFMFLFTLLSFGLFLFRLSGIVQAETTKSLLSVEFFIFLAITFLSVSAFLVLLGTSAPLITKLFGQASNVGVAYYVNTQLPLGIILALLLGFAPFLGWRGSKLNDLFKAFLPTLIMALLLIIFAFVLKVTFPLYLILMFVSFLTVIGNLTVLYKRSQAGWKSLGGFVTHVGVGLMLVGIITSSGYSRSVKLNLPENETKDAFGYQFTYLGTEGDTLNQKSVLMVKVEKGGNSFIAKPKLYFSEYNQAYMRTPYIRITPLYDLYLAPLENQTGEESGEKMILLKKGESKEVGGYDIKFVGFDMSAHGMEGGMRVGATLEITYENEKQTLTPAIVMGAAEAEDSLRVVLLPGGNDHLFLERINADDKSIVLDLIQTNPQLGKNLLVLEVSRKPLINVLWLGTILIMAGLVIATYRRAKESNMVRSKN